MALRSTTQVAIDQLVQHYHMDGRFNGTALVGESGEVLYEKACGMADFEWGVPNTMDTKFRIGSVSKQFTAALIMLLVEQGKISVHDPVTRYLPSYRRDTGDRITLHHLLTHTAGLPNYTANPDLARVKRIPFAPLDFVAQFCSGDLEFEPGADFAYSNSGYFILGAIIEQVTGLDYETALHRMVLAPAGLLDTGYDNPRRLLSRRARGYERDLEGITNADYVDMSIPYAAGALYSTARDLMRWDRVLRGETVLSQRAKQDLFTPALMSYAYGWLAYHLEPANLDQASEMLGVRGDPAGLYITAHGGNIDGFAAAFCRVVSHEQVIVLLNNTGLSLPGQMVADILKILHGQPYVLPKRPAAPLLYAMVAEEGVEAALSAYSSWRADPAAEYEVGLGELSRLARQCAKRGLVEAAGQVLELAAREFPAAASAQMELAAHDAQTGRAAAALGRYRALTADRPELPGYLRRRVQAEIARIERGS